MTDKIDEQYLSNSNLSNITNTFKYSTPTTMSATAYFTGTFPQYWRGLFDLPDAGSPEVLFHDKDGKQTVYAIGSEHFQGYGNSYKRFN